VPASFPTPLAAGFLIGYGTSYFALKRRGALQTGEWLLVSGAAGKVGLAAIDIAKRMGARVIAAEISAEKLAMARAHGADECIDCSTENLHEAVKRITRGRGYDVYLDLVGGNLFRAALHTAAPYARLLIVGFVGGEIPQIPANYLLLKNLSAIGVGFGGAIANDVQGLCRSVVADLVAMHARQPFSAEVGGEYRLENEADGLKRLSSRNAIGKLLMRP
jgi:NADPH2:quinone reductase